MENSRWPFSQRPVLDAVPANLSCRGSRDGVDKVSACEWREGGGSVVGFPSESGGGSGGGGRRKRQQAGLASWPL